MRWVLDHGRGSGQHQQPAFAMAQQRRGIGLYLVVLDQLGLRGRDIAWEANGARFEGRLEGGLIKGELIGAQSRQPLVLTRAR